MDLVMATVTGSRIWTAPGTAPASPGTARALLIEAVNPGYGRAALAALLLNFFFLALPQLNIVLTGLWAGVLALGLNYGAYMSETFRAGLASVGKGQREAAIAIGMTPAQTMRRIVLPQALRFAIPPMGNDFIAMTKDSALVSATGFVHELMWRAQKVGRAEFRNMEALVMAAIFYWIMTLLLTSLQSRLETRLSKGDR